jgi:uncharacterized protein
VCADPDLGRRFQVSRRPPAIVLRVTVCQAYLHCAKALMRSRLWDPGARIDRVQLPTMGEMMRDHVGGGTLESQGAMVERYREQLY